MAAKKLDLYRLGVVVEVSGQKSLTTLHQVEKQSNSVQTSFKGLRTEIGSLKGSLGGSGDGGGLFGTIASGLTLLPGLGTLASAISKVAGVMKAGGKIGFDFNRTMEEGHIALEVMLKDGAKAKALLNDLDKMSPDSPFDLTKLVDSTPKLLAFKFGVQEVTRVLTAAGDAAGNSEQKFDTIITQLGQIRTKGKANLEELLPIAESGVDVFGYLGDEVAKLDKKFAKLTGDDRTRAVQEMLSRNALSSRGVIEAILRGIERDFGGMGKRMANETASGLESQMRDNLGRTIGKASASSFEAYKDLLRTGSSLVSSEAVQGLAVGIDKNLGTIINAGARMGKAVYDGARSEKGLNSNSPSVTMIPVGIEAGEGLIVGYEGYMQGRGLQRLVGATRKFSDDIEAEIEKNARRRGVDPDLIRSMMKQESGGRRGAVSHKGASGLMQLMPATAARFGVKNIFDPAENIRAGVEYMAWLLKRFNGNLELALAGYNAGEGAVDKYKGKIPPYRETQNYVASIMRDYERRKGTLAGDDFISKFVAGENDYRKFVQGQGKDPLRLSAEEGREMRAAYANRDKAQDNRAFFKKIDDGLYYVSNAGEIFNVQNKWPSGTQGVGSPVPMHTYAGNVSDPYAVASNVGGMANADTLIKEYARRNAIFFDQSRPLPVAIANAGELWAMGGVGGLRDPASIAAGLGVYANLRSATGALPVTTETGTIGGEVSQKSFEMLPRKVGDLNRQSADALPPIEGLVKKIGTLSKVAGMFPQIAGMMPQQQVGQKRGFFSKLLGVAAPFLGFIPGVGPLLSTLAGIGSSALGGDWGGALMATAGGFASGGAFRRAPTPSAPLAPQVVNFTNPAARLPGREHGGPVRRGRAYVVGERRAEVVEFGDDGYVHPSIDAFKQSQSGNGGSSGGGKEGFWNGWREHMDRLASAIEKFETMSPGEVLTRGAKTHPGAIGDGLMRAGTRDPQVVEWMRRRTTS